MELNEIRNKIHTVNPHITDEVLDLLYEYFACCLKEYFSIDKTEKEICSDEFTQLLQQIICK